MIDSFNIKRFGYSPLFRTSAMHNFKNGFNVYVLFYFNDCDTRLLAESPIYLLDKDFVNKYDLDFKSKFKDALNEIKMKFIFPNPILETFFFTDFSRIIPSDFLKNDNAKTIDLGFTPNLFD